MNLGRLMIDVPSFHGQLETKVSRSTISQGTQMNYVPGGLGIMGRQEVQAAGNQGLK
jgi:hypothetical protein